MPQLLKKAESIQQPFVGTLCLKKNTKELFNTTLQKLDHFETLWLAIFTPIVTLIFLVSGICYVRYRPVKYCCYKKRYEMSQLNT